MTSKKWLTVLFGVLLIGTVVFGYFYGKRYLLIDSCLDKGGSWDYEKSICDTSVQSQTIQTQEFVQETLNERDF